MAIKGYVTSQEIVDFMEMINPEFLATDINEMIVNAMYEVINNKLDGTYAETDMTLYQDGRNDKVIFCPQIPIVAIKGISIVELNGEETQFIINGTDRNIWWDSNTGKIWTETYNQNEMIEINNYENKFPERTNCVKIVGTFGEVASDIVKQLQLMLIMKQYSLLMPSIYASDIISEKIGRYEYKLANASNVEPANQRKGLDGWIYWLFQQIPNKENAMCLEVI